MFKEGMISPPIDATRRGRGVQREEGSMEWLCEGIDTVVAIVVSGK